MEPARRDCSISSNVRQGSLTARRTGRDYALSLEEFAQTPAARFARKRGNPK